MDQAVAETNAGTRLGHDKILAAPWLAGHWAVYTVGLDTASPHLSLLQRWREQPWLHVLCAFLVIGPFYGLAILNGVKTVSSGSFELPGAAELALQAVLLVVVLGGLTVVLHVYVCGEPLHTLFATRFDTPLRDLLFGIGLYAALMGSVMLVNLTLYLTGAQNSVSDAVKQIAEAAAQDPKFLYVLLGPVVWLQAALIEELTRVFLLQRLWRAFPGKNAELGIVVLSALLFGAAHLYQGWQAILPISMIGLLLGLYFRARRRIFPMIVAHGLFDSTTIIIAYTIARYMPEMLDKSPLR